MNDQWCIITVFTYTNQKSTLIAWKNVSMQKTHVHDIELVEIHTYNLCICFNFFQTTDAKASRTGRQPGTQGFPGASVQSDGGT